MTSTTTHSAHETPTFRFVGVKGGVGTTTVAALTALKLAHSGGSVRLSAIANADVADLASMFDLDHSPTPGEAITVRRGITLADCPSDEVVNVIDAGTGTAFDTTGLTFLVVRNDSLSLRRVETVEHTVDGILLVLDPRHDIGPFDIDELLEEAPPVIGRVPVTAAITNAIDQGLLSRTRSRKILDAISDWHPFPALDNDQWF